MNGLPLAVSVSQCRRSNAFPKSDPSKSGLGLSIMDLQPGNGTAGEVGAARGRVWSSAFRRQGGGDRLKPGLQTRRPDRLKPELRTFGPPEGGTPNLGSGPPEGGTPNGGLLLVSGRWRQLEVRRRVASRGASSVSSLAPVAAPSFWRVSPAGRTRDS